MKTTESEIEHIKEILPLLDETFLNEVKDFTHYLLDKQRKRKAFADRVLKAEQETPIRFKSVDEAVKAVFDAPSD